MLLLISGATRTLQKIRHPKLGRLISPRSRHAKNVEKLGLKWAADNDCFTGFNPGEYLKMLRQLAGKPGCLFVTLPDAVGDAATTVALFQQWEPVVKSYGFPCAFVIQDGQEAGLVPWDKVQAVFIGGTTEFKLGPQARAIACEAKKRALWVHMGRVNSLRRIRYARRIGCDSFDGSGYSRFPGKIPRALAELSNYQLELDFGV